MPADQQPIYFFFKREEQFLFKKNGWGTLPSY